MYIYLYIHIHSIYIYMRCVFSLSLTQDKYFRLENINSPKIIVKSLLDYDVVQKISLVLHVQVKLPKFTYHDVPRVASVTFDPSRHIVSGYAGRLGLRQALLHLRSLHHGAGEGRG